MGRVWPCRCHRTVRASGVSGKRCDLCCRERSRKRLRHEKTPLAVVGVNIAQSPSDLPTRRKLCPKRNRKSEVSSPRKCPFKWVAPEQCLAIVCKTVEELAFYESMNDEYSPCPPSGAWPCLADPTLSRW